MWSFVVPQNNHMLVCSPSILYWIQPRGICWEFCFVAIVSAAGWIQSWILGNSYAFWLFCLFIDIMKGDIFNKVLFSCTSFVFLCLDGASFHLLWFVCATCDILPNLMRYVRFIALRETIFFLNTYYSLRLYINLRTSIHSLVAFIVATNESLFHVLKFGFSFFGLLWCHLVILCWKPKLFRIKIDSMDPSKNQTGPDRQSGSRVNPWNKRVDRSSNFSELVLSRRFLSRRFPVLGWKPTARIIHTPT